MPQSYVITTMFVTILKRQFGDARFIQFTQPFGNHSVILLFGCACQRQIETNLARQIQRNTAILGGVGGGEEYGVLAILHVLAVGLQNARSRSSLGKNLAQFREIKAESVP